MKNYVLLSVILISLSGVIHQLLLLGVNDIYFFEFDDLDYSMPMLDFKSYLIFNYPYSKENKVDCKFYANEWEKWSRENDFKNTFITSSTHIFNVIENESHYCVINHPKIDCEIIIR